MKNNVRGWALSFLMRFCACYRRSLVSLKAFPLCTVRYVAQSRVDFHLASITWLDARTWLFWRSCTEAETHQVGKAVHNNLLEYDV